MLAGIWRAYPALRRPMCSRALVRLVIQVRDSARGFLRQYIAAP